MWVSSFGIPDLSLTYNGRQFASVFYQGFMGLLRVVATYATPYHPQTNVQVERYNRTIVRQLRTYVSEYRKEWDRYCSIIALRNEWLDS